MVEAVMYYDCSGCGNILAPCPRCGETTCLQCEDWQRHHTVRAWLARSWRPLLYGAAKLFDFHGVIK